MPIFALWLVGCVFITEADIEAKRFAAEDPRRDRDGDGFARAVDCDDENPLVHPDRPEVANGVDDDCDGLIDEGSLFYDDDGDGFCEQAPCVPREPGGELPEPGDCDDAMPAVYPDAPEICDHVKNDCLADWDENDDFDGDGYSIAQGDPNDRDRAAVPTGAQPLIAELACFTARIPAGSFVMGCEGSDECFPDAQPAHPVHLSRDLLVARTEVTREQWGIWMSDKRWIAPECGDRCPATRISALEAMEFARRMNLHLGLTPCEPDQDPVTCEGWRLPTEAEWERAARADTSDPYSGGTNASLVGWMLDNSGGLPHPVATRAANRWGLYDMTGNTWEWTLDAWYVYQNVEATDPWESLPEEVPLEEGELIIRGGGANTLRREGTVYHRLSFDTTHAFFADQGDAGDLNPENPFNHFGFRLVRNAP